MKRYILTSLCLLTYLTLSAQEPKEALFTVNAQTEDGRDTTFVVSAINANSFSFVGGGGKVTNPENGRQMTVDNVDLYSYIDYEDPSSAIVKTIINPDLKFAEMGYCLSKKSKPRLPGNLIIDNNSYITNDTVNGILFKCCRCDLIYANPFDDNPNPILALKADSKYFYPSFSNLEYGATYYLCPYVRFSNGEVMYGSELSFKTVLTMESACQYEEDMAEWSVLNGEKGLALNTHALMQVYNAYAEDYGNLNKSRTALSTIMSSYLGSRDWSALKNNARTMQCADGTLYVVNDVGKEFIDGFHNLFVTTPQVFSPDLDDVYFDNEEVFTNPATTDVQYISCESKWNVPNNHYLMASPLNNNRNTVMTVNIPNILLTSKTYQIEILFAPVAEVDAQDLPSRLRFQWFSTAEADALPNENQPAKIFKNGTSQNFEIENTGKCETVVLEYTPDNIDVHNWLRIQSYALMSQASTYSKVIRIAQIKISPNN